MLKLFFVDHTTHSRYGHVMFANIGKKDGTATLSSRAMSNLQRQCLTFYFLRGGTGVSLSLLKFHTSTGATESRPLWQSNETHLVNEWIRVEQELLITDSVKMIFEAKKLGKFFT